MALKTCGSLKRSRDTDARPLCMLCLILLISCSVKTNAEPPDTGNGSALSLSEHADAAQDGVLAVLPGFLKDFLLDGINYRLNRYQSLKLTFSAPRAPAIRNSVKCCCSGAWRWTDASRRCQANHCTARLSDPSQVIIARGATPMRASSSRRTGVSKGGVPGVRRVARKDGRLRYAAPPGSGLRSLMLSVDEPAAQIAVGIDAAIAQERPVHTGVLRLAEVDRRDQNGSLGSRRAREHGPARCGHKALSPKIDAVPRGRPRRRLEPGAVNRHDVTSVGNGVGALRDLPGLVLLHAASLFFLRMPTYRRRVEQDLGAAERRQSRRPRGTTDPSRLKHRGGSARCGRRETVISPGVK